MSTDKLNEISRAIGRLEGKVDGINARLDRTNGTIANNSTKIDKCEEAIATSKGKATLLGAIAGFLISIVIAVINYFKS